MFQVFKVKTSIFTSNTGGQTFTCTVMCGLNMILTEWFPISEYEYILLATTMDRQSSTTSTNTWKHSHTATWFFTIIAVFWLFSQSIAFRATEEGETASFHRGAEPSSDLVLDSAQQQDAVYANVNAFKTANNFTQAADDPGDLYAHVTKKRI